MHSKVKNAAHQHSAAASASAATAAAATSSSSNGTPVELPVNYGGVRIGTLLTTTATPQVVSRVARGPYKKRARSASATAAAAEAAAAAATTTTAEEQPLATRRGRRVVSSKRFDEEDFDADADDDANDIYDNVAIPISSSSTTMASRGGRSRVSSTDVAFAVAKPFGFDAAVIAKAFPVRARNQPTAKLNTLPRSTVVTLPVAATSAASHTPDGESGALIDVTTPTLLNNTTDTASSLSLFDPRLPARFDNIALLSANVTKVADLPTAFVMTAQPQQLTQQQRASIMRPFSAPPTIMRPLSTNFGHSILLYPTPLSQTQQQQQQ